MSFTIDWSKLGSESLSGWTKDFLTDALNSGRRPNVLASDIEIKDLNFGKVGPNFEILEIGELGNDRFRGIFKINYDGDFHLTLHTKVQANPFNIYSSNSHEREINNQDDQYNFITPSFILADHQFALPLDLKLSDIKISGIGIIVFSKSKGLTLVFRNDPLDSIKVSSTFDTVQVLANFLQAQIEKQIRDLFRETLPTLIHQLSLKYILSSEDSDFVEFQSKLKSKLIGGDSDSGDKVSIKDVYSEFAYSSKNLTQNLRLFNSTETLALNVPRFRNTIQRSRLEKYNKTSPNLGYSLNNRLLMVGAKKINHVNLSNNEIPIDMIVRNDVEVNTVLREIVNIQSAIYYSRHPGGSGFKNSTKPIPKRRVITFHSKKSRNAEASVSETSQLSDSTLLSDESHNFKFGITKDRDATDSQVSSSELSSSMSSNFSSDTIPLEQPKPIRYINEVKSNVRPTLIPGPVESHSHFYQHFNSSNSSPTHANSSLLSGVGIGNNYFNFNHSKAISTSPVKEHVDAPPKEKSLNYVDLDAIKEKIIRAKADYVYKLGYPNEKNMNYSSFMEFPPPPYRV